MSEGLGGLVGIASSANVPLNDILASVATLTANGLPASQSITSLKQAISGIIKPTSEAKKMADELNIKFDAQALASKGLSGVLADVQAKTGSSTEKMAQLFGSVEALNAVMVLTTKEGSKSLQENLLLMNDSVGKTDEVFNKISSESGFKFNQSINELTNSLIKVGDSLSPIINVIATLLSVLAGIDPAVIIIIASLTMAATVILQVVKAINSLTSLGGGIGKFASGVDVGMLKTTAIILGVVAALIALGAIIAVIIGRGGELQRTMSSVGESVGKVNSTVKSAQNNVPRYASGTNYHPGGGAYITEYAPEQLTLPSGANYVVMPKGTKVNPNVAMGGGVTNNYIFKVDDIETFVAIKKKLEGEQQSYRMGYVGR